MSYGDYFDPSKPVTVEGEAAIQSQVAADNARKKKRQQQQQAELRARAAGRTALNFSGTNTTDAGEDRQGPQPLNFSSFNNDDAQDDEAPTDDGAPHENEQGNYGSPPLSQTDYSAQRTALTRAAQPTHDRVITVGRSSVADFGGTLADIIRGHKAQNEIRALDASQSQAERAQAARRAALAGRMAGTGNLDPELIYGILNGDAGSKDVLSYVQKQQEEERRATEHTEEKTTSASHYDAEQARLKANDDFSHTNSDRSYNLQIQSERDRATDRDAALQDRKDARTAADDARKTAAQDRADAAAEAKKNAKAPMYEAAMDAIDRLSTASDLLGEGGGPLEGKLPAMGLRTQTFDGAQAQAMTAIVNATKIPGMGSQSDADAARLADMLPKRTEIESVRKGKIAGVRAQIDILRGRRLAGDTTPLFGDSAPVGGAHGSDIDALVHKYSTPTVRSK